MNEVLLVIIEAITIMARWLSWLERRPVTAEVVGSNPIRVAEYHKNGIRKLNMGS